MADNMVTLVGNLGADPEVRRTPTGKDVVSFSLVTNERVRGTDGKWVDGASSWFKVTAWNELGVHAGLSFRKGNRVIVTGIIRVETWQARDGGTGKTVELTAQALGHDLRWGTSTFVRGVRSAPQQPPAAQSERPAGDGWGPAPEADGVPVEADAAAAAPAVQEPAMALAQPGWSTGFTSEDDTPF